MHALRMAARSGHLELMAGFRTHFDVATDSVTATRSGTIPTSQPSTTASSIAALSQACLRASQAFSCGASKASPSKHTLAVSDPLAACAVLAILRLWDSSPH